MRFRLVEDVDRRYLNFYDRGWEKLESANRIKDKVSYIMKKYMGISDPTRYPKLKGQLEDSIDTWSFDPNRNNFLAYLLTLSSIKGGELKGKWDSDNVQRNLDVLKTRALAGDELKKEWYYDVGTLNRPYKEFAYVINIANILSDDTKRAKYFGKQSPTTVDHIYNGDSVSINKKVKEPGIGSNDTNTIYGMINDWTQRYGAKDSGKEEEEKFSIIDVMRSAPETRDEAIRYDNSGEYVSKLYQLSLTDKFRKYRLAQILLSKYLSEKGARNSLLKAKIVDKKTLESIFVALEEKAKGLGIQ